MTRSVDKLPHHSSDSKNLPTIVVFTIPLHTKFGPHEPVHCFHVPLSS